jgi:hypothetical protein
VTPLQRLETVAAALGDTLASLKHVHDGHVTHLARLTDDLKVWKGFFACCVANNEL